MGHAFLLLASSDEGGVAVDQSIEFILSEPMSTMRPLMEGNR